MYDTSSDNIKELLIRIAEGDENAFRKIFKAYYNQLGDFIMQIADSERLTQEIVQDVFLKIWINRVMLAEVSCFKAYLFVVARNHAYNCLKQIARERTREKEWVNAVLYSASTNVIDEEDTTIAVNLIKEAVLMLPPQQQKVYVLSRVNGMRQQEIALQLNISLETVKKHMVLALRFLKNHVRTHTGIFVLLLSSLVNC